MPAATPSYVRWRKLLLYGAAGGATAYALYRLYKSEELRAWRQDCAKKYVAVKRLLALLETSGELAVPANAALQHLLTAIHGAQQQPHGSSGALHELLQQAYGCLVASPSTLGTALAEPTQSPGSAPQSSTVHTFDNGTSSSSHIPKSHVQCLLESVLGAAASRQGQTVLSLAIKVGANSLVEAVSAQLTAQQERQQRADNQCSVRGQGGLAPARCAVEAHPQWADAFFSALSTPQGSKVMSRALAVFVSRGVDTWLRAAGDVDVWDDLLRAMSRPAHRQVVHDMTHIFTSTAASTLVRCLTRPSIQAARPATSASLSVCLPSSITDAAQLHSLSNFSRPLPEPSGAGLSGTVYNSASQRCLEAQELQLGERGAQTVDHSAPSHCVSTSVAEVLQQHAKAKSGNDAERAVGQESMRAQHGAPGTLTGTRALQGTSYPAPVAVGAVSDSSDEVEDHWSDSGASGMEGPESPFDGIAGTPVRALVQARPDDVAAVDQPSCADANVHVVAVQPSVGIIPALKDTCALVLQKAVDEKGHRLLLMQLAGSACKGGMHGFTGAVLEHLRASTTAQVLFMAFVLVTWVVLLASALDISSSLWAKMP